MLKSSLFKSPRFFPFRVSECAWLQSSCPLGMSLDPAGPRKPSESRLRLPPSPCSQPHPQKKTLCLQLSRFSSLIFLGKPEPQPHLMTHLQFHQVQDTHGNRQKTGRAWEASQWFVYSKKKKRRGPLCF